MNTATHRPLAAYVGGGLFYFAINLTSAAFGALSERRLAIDGPR